MALGAPAAGAVEPHAPMMPTTQSRQTGMRPPARTAAAHGGMTLAWRRDGCEWATRPSRERSRVAPNRPNRVARHLRDGLPLATTLDALIAGDESPARGTGRCDLVRVHDHFRRSALDTLREIVIMHHGHLVLTCWDLAATYTSPSVLMLHLCHGCRTPVDTAAHFGRRRCVHRLDGYRGVT